MGKIKVYELAKELNLSNNDLIAKLKNIGIDVKSHLSSLTDNEYDKAKKSFDTKSEYIKNAGNVQKQQPSSQPHIIRRQVTVINTKDDGKSVVDEITTNISGDIQKTHHTIIDESKKSVPYSKEGLGFVTPKQGYQNRPRFGANKNNNVVITRNGKPIENENTNKINNRGVDNSNMSQLAANVENVENTENVENNEISGSVPQSNSQKTQEVTTNYQGRTPRYNNDYSNNRENRDNNNNNRSYNNQGYQKREGYNPNYNQNRNNGYQNNSENQGYQRREGYNPNFQNRNNGYQNNSNNQGYQRREGYNPNYNQNRSQNPNPRPNSVGPENKFNNNRPGFNRSGPYQGGFKNNNFKNGDNTSYQVNKFIKTSGISEVAEQKDMRDYSSTLIDKKKYNSDHSTNDGKKEKINKNELREQHSRVSTSKLKGLEVNTSSGLIDLYERDTDLVRKSHVKRKKEQEKPIMQQTKIIPMTEVKLPEVMTVKEFAEALKKQSSEIIKKLFALGTMATVNQEIDFDTAYLIASEFGITAEKEVVVTDEDILFDDSEDDEKDLVPRPPIVVVMGHVDHGKTSLLDKIRCASVVACEAGGITQHIGAYKVEVNEREICFLDTPGHEAFTQMRARGAQITDIAIIVVAADDGIKPQTIEAIDHAKAAGVSIIVAINKIDKPTANPDRVKQELLEVGLVAEEWGGDTICVPISALTGQGIDTLLEMILLVADMKDLKSNPNKQAKGTVIEAKLDKNVGTVVSMLVQRGTLNVSDTIVVGDIIGKVRAMKDDKGRKVKKAGPSTPVEIIGLSQVPQTGDIFYEVADEKTAKHLVETRKAATRQNLIKQGSKVTLNDLFSQIKEGKVKELNVIIKADVQGSLEAIKDSLEKLSNDEVRVKIIHASTGAVKESDVTLAAVSNAIIIGFNIRPEATATIQAEKEKVDLRLYRVIYDAINDVEAALKGLQAPTYKEVIHGFCEARQIFKVSSIGTIAGCYVKKGKIIRSAMVRIIRDSIVICETKIDSLKRQKDDVKEVAEGYECGIKLENFNDIKENDIIECFELKEEKRV
ncbi:MAG: translation initiation factor IF-2 [Clostridia bacterium]|nr:translation initiation factor IF-2 [Clostridia bacterium]